MVVFHRHLQKHYSTTDILKNEITSSTSSWRKNKIIFKADFRFSQGSYNISLEFSTLLGSQFETSSYTTAFIGQGLKHLTKLLEMKHLAATDF